MDSVLQFDPPTLTINDTTGMTSFKVSLMAGPQANGQVEVQFKSDTLMFSTCHVLFNATNYDQPASINVWPKPTYVDAAKAIADDSNFGHTTAYTNDVVVDTLPIELNINGNGYENATAIYNVTRNVVPAAYCGISGDPHFSTFDNGRVNSADIGYHYYVKSDYLTIQGAQFECMASGATCIQGKIVTFYFLFIIISILYLNYIFSLFLSQSFFYYFFPISIFFLFFWSFLYIFNFYVT